LLLIVAIVLSPFLFWPAFERMSSLVAGHPVPLPTVPARPVASVTFEDGDGRPVTLEAFRGRPVLVNVWATWCPPCREELPSLDRLKTIAEREGVFDVVAISVDRVSLEQLRSFLSVNGVAGLGLYRGDSDAVLRALRVPGLPTTVLLDAQGREVARLLGPTAWDAPEVVAALRQALARAP
jgi:thiol-disulfide isomerase/thioredoxin